MKLALVVITALLLAIAVFISHSVRTDRVSAWLFVPYIAWVVFATLLNTSLVALN
ncbi:MAG TPA: tryptophan-rich sensory protein [Afipia sp.]